MESIPKVIWKFLKDAAETTCILSGIALLNTPALICRARPGSTLYSLRTAEPFRRITPRCLETDFSFSPMNIKSGRWHTLVTSLFNHAGLEHLLGNVIILSFSTSPVLQEVGIKHFFGIYLGGGIFGNIVLLLEFIVQKTLWRGSMPSVSGMWLVGDSLEKLRCSSMNLIYDTVNEWRPVVGASGCVAAVLGFYTCVTITRIVKFYHQIPDKKSFKVSEANTSEVKELGVGLFRDTFLTYFTISQFRRDLSHFMEDFKNSSENLIDGVMAYSADGIGHGSHLGGYVFGIFYFLMLRRKTLFGVKV